jgi:protein-S-isoprenylcysteine O-methyltransferase Ste14
MQSATDYTRQEGEMAMNRFTKWAEREFGITQRVTATLLAGVIFVVAISLFIVQLSSALDRWLGIPRFEYGLPNHLVGGLTVLIGWVLAMWSVVAQLAHGRGTPLPMMATQTLLTTGPFEHCRNPMSLGTIVLYSGIGMWIGSFSAIGIVIVLSGLLLVYLRRVEERELEERFGETYLEYKERTPFLIPQRQRRSE